MDDIVLAILEESISVKRLSIEANRSRIIRAANLIASCMDSGNKVLIFGNGGSAADAQHIAAEFVNRFKIERPPLAALALTTDTSILTSIGNDYHFDQIFAKQLKALGKNGDVAIAISTSGNSPNVIQGIHAAKEIGMMIIGMTGKDGGNMAAFSDILLNADSTVTARIQETHITMGHIVCELVDRILFPEAFK